MYDRTPVVGGVQITAADVIERGVVTETAAGLALWTLAGHNTGVTMVVYGTAAEMTALAHRLLDMLAELDGETL
jgi:hypothetical protein